MGIRSSFSDRSRDVAMATNFKPKLVKELYSACSHSETDWKIITMRMGAMADAMIRPHRVELRLSLVQ